MKQRLTDVRLDVCFRRTTDFVLWYGKDIEHVKYRRIIARRRRSEVEGGAIQSARAPDGKCVVRCHRGEER